MVIPETRKFTDMVRDAGVWNGRAIEGFVVRCESSKGCSWTNNSATSLEMSTEDLAESYFAETKSKKSKRRRKKGKQEKENVPPESTAESVADPAADGPSEEHLNDDMADPNSTTTTPTSPTASDSSPVTLNFMFKVKYDDPYLMFREFREVTKPLLTSGGSRFNRRPKFPLTEHYIKWVKKKMRADPSYFEGYLQNQGIIKARVDFMNEWEARNEKKCQASRG